MQTAQSTSTAFHAPDVTADRAPVSGAQRFKAGALALTASAAVTRIYPNRGMMLSDDGRALIESFEGWLKPRADGSFDAYQCPAGVWTIGPGCTEGVHQGMVRTRDECDRMFARELGHFEIIVGRLVAVPLTQHEFDAILSFAYNCGQGALETSTLLKELNAGRHANVPAQLLRWTKGGGKVLNGLIRRRKAEGALFLSGPALIEHDPSHYGPMPQQVEAVASNSAASVVKSSRTFKGAAVATLGLLGSKAMAWFGVVGDAAAQAETAMSGLKPLSALLGQHAEGAMLIVGLIGIAMALFARFDAAHEGKVG
jgi:lysozyme